MAYDFPRQTGHHHRAEGRSDQANRQTTTTPGRESRGGGGGAPFLFSQTGRHRDLVLLTKTPHPY